MQRGVSLGRHKAASQAEEKEEKKQEDEEKEEAEGKDESESEELKEHAGFAHKVFRFGGGMKALPLLTHIAMHANPKLERTLFFLINTLPYFANARLAEAIGVPPSPESSPPPSPKAAASAAPLQPQPPPQVTWEWKNDTNGYNAYDSFTRASMWTPTFLN